MIRRQRHNLLVLSFFLLLTAVSAWPILAQADKVLAGDDIDAYINPWADWWTWKAVREADTTLWYTDYLFYPEGTDLTFHSFSHLNTAVSLALNTVMGRLAAYNLTILLNYVLAGLAMFQLARYLTGSAGAALLAGVVFAFNSHSLYQSSHPVLVSIWVFPWFTLFLMRALRENSRALALGAALFLWLAALTGIHLLLLLAIWLALFLAYTALSGEGPPLRPRLILLMGVCAGLATLPVIYPQLRAGLLEGNESFMVEPGYSISADLASYLFSPRGGFYKRNLYLGILPALLALLALARKREARLWFLLFLLSVILALGPIPHVLDQEIGITLPWALPLAAILRNMYRANILVSLGLAMLVAYGWLVLRAGLGSRRWAQAAILPVALLLILLDYDAFNFPYTEPAVSPFYTDYLQKVPEEIALAVIPSGRQSDKPHLFEQTFHERKITGGVVSRSEGRSTPLIRNNAVLRAGAFRSGSAPVPTRPREALQELAALNIGYLVIDKTGPIDVQEWRRALGMVPVYEDALVLVYETQLARGEDEPPAEEVPGGIVEAGGSR